MEGFSFVESASANNLKNINVKIPLNIMTVVTGVSGSGKSSLVNDVLFNFIDRYLSSGIKNRSIVSTSKGIYN